MTHQQRCELTAASSSSRARNILMGLALIGVAVFLGYRGQAGAGGWYWVGATVLGLGGAAWAMASGMRSAPCPACGNKHWEITPGELEKCYRCGVYLQGDEEAVWLMDDEHVAPRPILEIELGQRFHWPASCCACGEAATRTIPVAFSTSQTGRNVALAAAGLAAGALVIRTGAGSDGSLGVPHCDAHDDGALLKSESVLLVRSHAFLRGFQGVNSESQCAAA